jgi:hypothetical protein
MGREVVSGNIEARSFHSGQKPEDLGSTDCEELSFRRERATTTDMTLRCWSRLRHRHAGYSYESTPSIGALMRLNLKKNSTVRRTARWPRHGVMITKLLYV